MPSLNQQVVDLQAEIDRTREAMLFLKTPQRYEPDAGQNPILHELRSIISAENSEADRQRRLAQTEQLLQQKSDQLDRLKKKQSGLAKEVAEARADVQDAIDAANKARQEHLNALRSLDASVQALSPLKLELEGSGSQMVGLGMIGRIPAIEYRQDFSFVQLVEAPIATMDSFNKRTEEAA